MGRKQTSDDQWETDQFDGFHVIKPTWQYHMPWQAAFGLSLMEMVKESEANSTLTHFEPLDIPATPPTVNKNKEENPDWIQYEDNFRLARAEARRRNVGKMQRTR